eukprot:1144113-Pelagomonas_calceolata.AAC.5
MNALSSLLSAYGIARALHPTWLKPELGTVLQVASCLSCVHCKGLAPEHPFAGGASRTNQHSDFNWTQARARVYFSKLGRQWTERTKGTCEAEQNAMVAETVDRAQKAEQCSLRNTA